jgi:hypothetical protein
MRTLAFNTTYICMCTSQASKALSDLNLGDTQTRAGINSSKIAGFRP